MSHSYYFADSLVTQYVHTQYTLRSQSVICDQIFTSFLYIYNLLTVTPFEPFGQKQPRGLTFHHTQRSTRVCVCVRACMHVIYMVEITKDSKNGLHLTLLVYQCPPSVSACQNKDWTILQ